jgi:hypothetical protein
MRILVFAIVLLFTEGDGYGDSCAAVGGRTDIETPSEEF